MSYEDEQTLVSVFRLGESLFGIPAARIQEVVQVGTITPVHHAPAFVAGIRNLRGRIVTVVDLRARLGLGVVKHGPDTRILMIDCRGELIGMLVDSVADTIFFEPSNQCAEFPNVQGFEQVVSAVYRSPSRLVSLLDQEAVFALNNEHRDLDTHQ